jgi:hypothetical protein
MMDKTRPMDNLALAWDTPQAGPYTRAHFRST